MTNFCPNCGGKVNPDDKFCKNCGATLTGPVEISKEKLTLPITPQWRKTLGIESVEVEPGKPPVLKQIPTKPSGPAWTYTITNILGVLMGLGIVFLVLYSLGCAMGMFPNTQDQMCQSIHQAFSGGGGTTGGGESGGGGGGGCTPTGCPSSAPWYGCGSCWPTSNLCNSRGTSIITDNCSVCRKCP